MSAESFLSDQATAEPETARPFWRESRRPPWRWAGLVVAIWSLQVVGSYLWLQAQGNALLGWDPVGHLWRTAVYSDILTRVSPVTLFQAFALDNFRPPLFHFATVIMYRLCGISAEVAVMTNFPFLLLLLLAVYGIGKKLPGGPAAGALAAFLTSVFPLTFGLGRAFYVDLALTAWVAASIWLLMQVDEWRAKGYSVLLGLCIGLGLLTKWTYPLFVAMPLVYVLVFSPALRDDLRRQLGTLHVAWPRLGLSVVGGLVFSLLWSLPNWEAISHRPLGVGLAVFWAAVLSLFIYALSARPRRASPLGNGVAALSLAALLASLWYLTNSDFWQQVYQRSYGGMEGSLLGGRQNAAVFILSTLDYVPRRLVRSDLGWPFGLLLLFMLGKLVYDSRPFRRDATHGASGTLSFWTGARPGWILGLWWVIPLFVFTLSINREERSWLPLLPALALVMATGLLRLAAGWGKTTLIVLVVLFGLGQWFALSYEGLAGIAGKLEYARSPLGPIGPLASGEYVRWPNWEWTDRRYGVAGDILSRASADAAQRGLTQPVLGVLVRLSQLHGDGFRYLIHARNMDMELWDLAETGEGLVTYPRLFLCDYVILNTGHNDFSNPEAEPVAEALTQRPPAAFERTFETLARYPLPEDSELILYRRRLPDVWPDLPSELNPAQQKAELRFGDVLRLVGYDLTPEISSGQSFEVTLYWQVLKTMDRDYLTHLKLISAAYRVWGETHGPGSGPWALTTSWPRGQVVKDTRRVPVLPGTPPGEYRLEILLNDSEQRELLPAGMGDAFISPIVVQQGASSTQKLDIQHRSDIVLDHGIHLLGHSVLNEARPGSPLQLVLFWQAETKLAKSYTVFTHLVGTDGKVWAGKDNVPADGFYATSAWQPGEAIRDPYDIPLPPDLPPGAYRLMVGMYDAVTGARLTVAGLPQTELDLGITVVK